MLTISFFLGMSMRMKKLFYFRLSQDLSVFYTILVHTYRNIIRKKSSLVVLERDTILNST